MKIIKSLFGELDAWGKLWLYVGLFTLLFAMGMATEYGASVSTLHAGFLACLSIVTAFGPHAAHSVWEDGKKLAAIAIVVCLPMLFIMEFQSHAAYTAGLRGTNMAEASVQNTKYEGAQEATREDKGNLEMWKRQLATLLEANAWAATVKADALRDQVTLAEKEIADETARGGCKTKCNARMKDKADLMERIGKIEQAADLSKRIEATQRILDGKREKAAAVEYKPSTVDLQNKFLSKVVAMVGSGKLKASEFQTEGAEQFVNLSMAITATGLPALALFIAGLYRLPGSSRPQGPTYPLTPAQLSHGINGQSALRALADTARGQANGATLQPIIINQPPAVTHNTNTKDDEARAMLAQLKRALGEAYAGARTA